MNLKISIGKLCEKTGMSRQNFYKGRKRRTRLEVDAGLVEELVRAERAMQPRLGGKKLHRLLRPKLEEAGVRIGRDRFFEVLGERGLLLEPLPKAPRTTNSRHSLPVFRNLLADMELTGPNQAWVSDITYIRTDEGFLYLSLITDAWSRKIVGYHAGDTLETEGCLRALEKAVKELKAGLSPVHHSDRGCQYCSHLYTGRLREYGLGISMTEEMHCYENAKAERVNGILKQEYFLGGCFRTKRQAIQAVDQAVWLYNTRRPHLALNYETPAAIHEKLKKAV
ncbi:MAG: IS3 family transposase [Verrucomicrobiota bacterium]